MLTWILALAPIVAIYAVYRIYRKKAAQRQAASGKRFEEIFGSAASTSTRPAPAAPAAVAAAPQPPAWSARERLLESQNKLVYYLLRNGLPDCEVFAQVSLSALVCAAQPDRKTVEGIIDFVVCDKQMKPLAAIRVAGANGFDAVGEIVKSAGMRWVRIIPGALPQRSEIRSVVLGN